MNPFIFSNEIVICFTLMAYLLVAFVGVVCFAMSILYKLNPFYIIPEVIISAVSVILFCYFSDVVRVRYLGLEIKDITSKLCFMPSWSVIIIGVILLALVVMWLIVVIKKRLSSLTAMSVKEAIAALSAGLCFYDETGRILLINEQIDKECQIITGEALYDGIAFWSKMNCGKTTKDIKIVKSEGTLIIELPSGRSVCYKRIEHIINGKKVYELSGTDVSRELALKNELEQKNENLSRMNLRLRKYGETVAEVTRERETLAARIKVHANLGSLILRTKKALSQNESDRKMLISEWNDILSIVFASDEKEDKFLELENTAKSIGVKIFYDGNLPPKGTFVEKLFVNAIFECVVNTARHADGNELYVQIDKSETVYTITLTNNGIKPTNEIKEGGGLSSLRRMTENAGGQMSILSSPRFKLLLTIPKEVSDE